MTEIVRPSKVDRILPPIYCTSNHVQYTISVRAEREGIETYDS